MGKAAAFQDGTTAVFIPRRAWQCQEHAHFAYSSKIFSLESQKRGLPCCAFGEVKKDTNK